MQFDTNRYSFGLILPRETGIEFSHQSGGICMSYPSFEGVFIPLSNPIDLRGRPDWGFDDITELKLESELSDRDYESLPEWVKERGHFYNYDEYSYWIDQVWWYGSVNLLKELMLWNYDHDASMEHVERDMRETWDTKSELWSAIDERLPFTYETFTGNEEDVPFPDECPEPMEAVKWIQITGQNESYGPDGYPMFPEEVVGEPAIMVYPNSD